jgi:hypothetical protein
LLAAPALKLGSPEDPSRAYPDNAQRRRHLRERPEF